MKHEPRVLERLDWRVTKAACSCGAETQLAGKVGSVTGTKQEISCIVSEAQDRERSRTTETCLIRFASSPEMKPAKDLQLDAEATKDRPAEVTVTPEKALATFMRKCGHFCGEGHASTKFVAHVTNDK